MQIGEKVAGTAGRRLHAFVVSWAGRHRQAAAIAAAVGPAADRTTIVYSEPDADWEPGWPAGCDAVRRPDQLFWADKFQACLGAFEGGVLLVIHADTDCDDWARLAVRCRAAFAQVASLGVWAPCVQGTPYYLERSAVGVPSAGPLQLVAQTDGIVFALAQPVVDRMRQANLSANLHGWGIDWMYTAHAWATHRRVMVDREVVVDHESGRGYPAGHAASQMRQFLGEQLSDPERLQYQLLNSHILRWNPQLAPAAAGSPLVSIVTPTWNRGALIDDCIRSVLAQDFGDWELLVVDDGSADGTAQRVRQHRDARIRLLSTPHRGAARARNRGLRAARGRFVAYLDSDNLMEPGFLRQAVDRLQRAPAVGLVYGQLLGDHPGVHEGRINRPFDPQELLRQNYIDLNTVVHARWLVQSCGGFDPGLQRLLDWDLVLRLAKRTRVEYLPVPAARYRVLEGPRITAVEPYHPNLRRIQRKHLKATQPPLRVLYVMWHYPQLSETYIETEIVQMRAWGCEVQVWREVAPVSPYTAQVPVHSGDLREAISAMQPDIIHVHWLNYLDTQADVLASAGVPVTVKLHGFEVHRRALARWLPKRWLAAAYGFAHQVAQVNGHPKLKVFRSAFDSRLFAPRRDKDRRLVVRTGACLPSKDIALFIELAGRLPQFRFALALVTCNGHEAYVQEVRALVAASGSPVELHFDLPRPAVAELVAQAGIYLHTAAVAGMPHATALGNPISIVEAMATGAWLLVRDDPVLTAYVQETGSGYRDLAQAQARLLECLGWDDAAWDRAWMRSVERAHALHADFVVTRPLLNDWLQMAGRGVAAEPAAELPQRPEKG